MIKPNKRLFYIMLGGLAAILIVFGLLRMKFGQFLPDAIDKNLPDVVMFSAVGILLWNRKILNDEKKAEAARKKEEEEAAAAKAVTPVDAGPETEDGEKGNDAPG